MTDAPAVDYRGYCTNTTPVPGTTERVNGHALGGKFFKMHGRRYASCLCGKRIGVTAQGNLSRHKPPKQ
ncbi:hypothetical protein [Streptomyces spectabilis]|uniref:Uncharacterized protein n=1 Tax=Streptomyces spectabilis TaxID=68270 RepID=A0A7W8EXP9_STRST|nr:hypothetical protein [Streptomyces spectabilis]MBB5109302.1 hypothetical protein [Streptomyces spectabilis]GGV52320.1 hypothetical protein GCM10010245_82300 [Streptomyces spectabilis]